MGSDIGCIQRKPDTSIPPPKKNKKAPLEKDAEAYLRKEIMKRGGLAYKFSSMQRKGVSDRIVFIYGMVFFVEMKREGVVELSPTQVTFFKEVNAQKGYVCVVSGHDGVDEFLEWVDRNKPIILSIMRVVRFLIPRFRGRVFRGVSKASWRDKQKRSSHNFR